MTKVLTMGWSSNSVLLELSGIIWLMTPLSFFVCSTFPLLSCIVSLDPKDLLDPKDPLPSSFSGMEASSDIMGDRSKRIAGVAEFLIDTKIRRDDLLDSLPVRHVTNVVVKKPHGKVVFISSNKSSEHVEPARVPRAYHVPETVLMFISLFEVKEEVKDLLVSNCVQRTLHAPEPRHGKAL